MEGETDFHIIKGILNYFGEHSEDLKLRNDITVISCSGSNINQYAEWLISENFDIKIILDNDDGGDSHAQKLKSQISKIDERDIERISNKDGAEVEDIFSPNFYCKQVNEIFSDIKEFSDIKVNNSDNKMFIEDEEIQEDNFTDVLESVLEGRGINFDRSHKKEIGKLIRSKLESGSIPDQEKENLKKVVGIIKNLI